MQADENLRLWTHGLVEFRGALEHRASGAAEGRFVGVHVVEAHASQPTEVAADLGAAFGGLLRERVGGHCQHREGEQDRPAQVRTASGEAGQSHFGVIGDVLQHHGETEIWTVPLSPPRGTTTSRS